MPKKRWRCFHCDEVFTSYRRAREHFGANELETTACKLASHEGHILTALRKAQDELAGYRAEDGDLMRAIHSLEADKADAVRHAEETGYAKAVADMKMQGYCADPSAHAMTRAA